MLDLNFAALANQTLVADGAHVLGTTDCTKANTANEAAAMAIVNGTGLVIQPAAGSDYNGAVRTAPILTFSIPGLLSSAEMTHDFRAWAQTTGEPYAAAYDAHILAVERAGLGHGYVCKRGRMSDGVNSGIERYIALDGVNMGFNSAGVTGAPPLVAANRCMVLEASPIYAGGLRSYHGAPAAGELPAATSLTAHNFIVFPNIPTSISPITDWRVTLGAQRAGSATALSCAFARLLIQRRG